MTAPDVSSSPNHRLFVRPGRWSDKALAFLALTILSSLAYLTPTLDEQWVPFDEGSLGQMAQRTLAGQLPHRDFTDIYTGGLSFYDAAVFWVFGTDLLWLRVAMLPFFVIFVWATYYIASKLTPPWFAALLTITLVVWTVPNYPAAMPSWYNLYLAVAGVACVVKWIDTTRNRWLWLAGICGGLSIDVKIVGIYYVVGVVFFLFFRAVLAQHSTYARIERGRLLRLIAPIMLASLTLIVAIWTLAPRLDAAEAIAFMVPVGAATVTLMVTSRAAATSTFPVFASVSWFLGGAVVPILLFLVPFVWTGSVPALVSDVLDSEKFRTGHAFYPALSPHWILLSAVFLLAFSVTLLSRSRATIAAATGAVVYAAAASSRHSTFFFMNPLRELVPLLSVGTAVALVARARSTERARSVELLSLLFFVFSFTVLIQFPFAFVTYFQYVLPLVVLTAVGFTVVFSRNPGAVGTVVVAAYLAAGLFHLTPGVVGIWHHLRGTTTLTELDSTRARIYVPASDAATYQTVVRLLRAHARNGITLAGPDSPEIYYLAGLNNPTPMIFDFLTPPAKRRRLLLKAAMLPDLTAVVVNITPPFSSVYDASVMRILDARFPKDELVSRSYDVRWRS